MATEKQIMLVLNSLAEIQACGRCGTRLRYADFECPHCGADVDDAVNKWAARLVDRLDIKS